MSETQFRTECARITGISLPTELTDTYSNPLLFIGIYVWYVSDSETHPTPTTLMKRVKSRFCAPNKVSRFEPVGHTY